MLKKYLNHNTVKSDYFTEKKSHANLKYINAINKLIFKEHYNNDEHQVIFWLLFWCASVIKLL